MFYVQNIDSLEQPELRPYATMRRPHEQREQGIFVAEGEKVVRRLLESDFTVVSVLLPEKWVREYEPLLKSRRENIQVFLAEKKLLETLVGFSMFQGILAVGKVPAPHSLRQILLRAKSPRLFVAVDALSNAENLGALVRNCVAFNVQVLVVGETSSSPFLRRAVRNSMGTIFQLPVVELGHPKDELHESQNPQAATRVTRPSENLVEALRELRAAGVRCIAAHPRADGRKLSDADFTGDCCVVFGSEGYGISSAALEACDERVAIPMPPTVDSLNVGAAAAVFLYEANRQRGLA